MRYTIAGHDVSFDVADTVAVKHVVAFEQARQGVDGMAQMLAVVQAAQNSGLLNNVVGVVLDDTAPFALVATISGVISEKITSALDIPKAQAAK